MYPSRVWTHEHPCSGISDYREQLEVRTTTDTRYSFTSIRLELHLQHSLAVLDSDLRQGSSTAILGSSRQQCRLPAASRTPRAPRTQQPVHCESDIAKAKNQKHKRSFPHMPQTPQCTCGNCRQHSQDHVPCHAFPPKSASGANIFETCKKHARMRTCKPQRGSPLWRTRSTKSQRLAIVQKAFPGDARSSLRQRVSAECMPPGVESYSEN